MALAQCLLLIAQREYRVVVRPCIVATNWRFGMSKFAKFMGAGAVAAALTLGTAAQATPIVAGTPITTPPPVLTATGDVTAVYIFSDAGDHSTLDETQPVPFPLIFANNSTNVAGDTMDLGNQAGAIVFSLHDLTTVTNYLSNVPDADGNYHAAFSTTYTDFNEGALPAVVAAFIAGLPAGTSVTFVGWEDRTRGQGSDFDYNDLIFAFTNVGIVTHGTPEPLTLSLFGAGLAGAVAFRRRRKSQKTA